ncbi:Undecaprenyl-phosphate 4-deoxy-4-formamido-L-arabinose transferase [Chryseobacterium sp. MOF25P]|uniref:glycosyltransferase family 2 protein n=1 Tax=unclassified Chryseobacterium TaxID=2593645 RepID=UPI000805C6F2|nr:MULTISPECIES: glycosyltransferase family A protein [unclassified Chryseobacterium]OBW42867.1 Undecaprenyl-phosphate 4-deoxy-4-formamido-L-arabinose transferase [Chryseobacterium sp. MOF25P]OBW44903.1 Undecaprenyl-phosphate 4-deoxy-4-formamido-L-arabinose transferase [Chryseobacterium sp. BGARF1]
MKISVCIPVYNFDIRNLVAALRKEIQTHQTEAEIILIDDASDNCFNEIYQEASVYADQFIFLEKNIGRSKIRNLFLKQTKGEYLLFLDCDAKIDSSDFLENYLQKIEKDSGVEVIYGNFKIDSAYSKTLRNRYSVEREIFSGDRTSDFSVFKTVNFIIKRETFIKFPFNETLANYGYEDYVFAKKMELNKVRFSAINNPVIHVDDTSNEVFLAKTETAMNSLFQLSQDVENENYIKDIKVLRMARKIKNLGFSKLFIFLYEGLAKNIILKNLLSENPNVKYLDVYKLDLLVKKMR